MHKSASFRSVFKSPARFTAPGFVLGAARRDEVIVMAAILEQGAMAYVSLGKGCLQTRDFALSTYESKNPCKFPVVYREPRYALSQVVLSRAASSRPQRLPLNAPTPDDCGRHLLVAVMDGEAPYDCVLGFLSRLCQRGNRPAPSV